MGVDTVSYTHLDVYKRQAYNRLNGRLRGSLKAFRRSCWELDVARTGDADPQSHPYRMPPALTGRRRRPPLPAIVGPFGRPLGRPEEKAEYLGLCFERQFAPNPPMDWDFDEQVEMAVEDFLSLPITAEPEPIYLEEVSDRLAELQPRKAPGPDGVTNTCLLYTSRCV